MTTLKTPINADDHIRGHLRAPVTLVEYGDYECPYCGMAQLVVEGLRRKFGPNLCFAFRHFPLTQVHPMAESAAEAAEFAGLHNHFWEMHDALFANQVSLGMPLLFALATELALPQGALRDSLAAGLCAAKVQRDFLSGVRGGVNGTPAFFINGRRHDAPFDFPYLAVGIGAALAHVQTAS